MHDAGEKVSEAIKKSRSIIQQTRNSKTTQKMLKHGAAFLDKHGDSIMQRLETTDVDSVIERGKTVFSDPVERQKFLDQARYSKGPVFCFCSAKHVSRFLPATAATVSSYVWR